MDRLAQAAEDALLVHPHPALRLEELLRVLCERVDRTLTEDRLRRTLDRHPERFRIVESWRGGSWSRRSTVAERRTHAGCAWVVGLGEPPAPDPAAPRTARAPDRRLRESVRWLARGMDGRSVLASGRWYALVMEEREARRLVGRAPRGAHDAAGAGREVEAGTLRAS